MIKNKLKNRELSVGTWMAIPSTAIAEILCSTDIDFVVVDLEHSAISLRECEEMIRVITLKGKSALVRLSSIDPVQAKRVMDSGASGVIVPMVKTAEEAELIRNSIFYPPSGERGVGISRAQKFGPGFSEYFHKESKESILIVQIEHIDAVNNFEEIMSVEGVDAFTVGPYDLTSSMGIVGEFEHPDYLKVLAHLKDISEKNHYVSGIHIVEADPEELKRRIDEKYKFIAYSVDFRMIDKTIREGLNSISEYRE